MTQAEEIKQRFQLEDKLRIVVSVGEGNCNDRNILDAMVCKVQWIKLPHRDLFFCITCISISREQNQFLPTFLFSSSLEQFLQDKTLQDKTKNKLLWLENVLDNFGTGDSLMASHVT
jgi:hypothetical protein